MTFKEFAAKKVVGVPVLYLAGAAAIILGIVAWRMKATPDTTATDTTDTSSDAQVDENGLAVPGSDPYAGLSSTGTVTVVQQPTDVTATEPKTNDDWVRDGAGWLVAQHKADGTTAYAALSKYVDGSDRTYEENLLVNAWIEQGGPPPDPVVTSGTVGNPPPVAAQKQFPNPPGTHTVTGNADNSLPKLSTLYYGTDAGQYVDLLEFANPSVASASVLPVGTKIAVPIYHDPVFWTVPSTMTWAQAAGKNGITEQQLRNLNNGPAAWRNAPILAKGQRIRVK